MVFNFHYRRGQIAGNLVVFQFTLWKGANCREIGGFSNSSREGWKLQGNQWFLIGYPPTQARPTQARRLRPANSGPSRLRPICPISGPSHLRPIPTQAVPTQAHSNSGPSWPSQAGPNSGLADSGPTIQAWPSQAKLNSGLSHLRPICPNSGLFQLRPVPTQAHPNSGPFKLRLQVTSIHTSKESSQN